MTMRLARNPRLMMVGNDEPVVENRRHGRLRCEETRCCIGTVLNLSASGMLVKYRGRLIVENGQELALTVRHDSHESDVTVKAHVKRIERVGFRKYHYGLEFIDITDEQKKKLVDLARVASDQLVFHCSKN